MEKIIEPKETNRQIGPMFKNWIKKTTFCIPKLDIDNSGLDKMDRSILKIMITKFNGGPVGLESLGVAISEDARTIEEVYEPYLIKEGFIQRTPRGRKALHKSYKHLKINYPYEN